MKSIYHSENNHFADALPRPRIDKILEEAIKGKLLYVIAGTGYGKTQAVHSFIENQTDAVVRWIQLTEGDNMVSRYWENLTHVISFDNPDLAKELLEFGFPDTSTRFKQFANILKRTEHRALKTYLVLDDFHVIHNEQALLFAERCAHLHIPGACVIIISRNEPAINAVSLLSRGEINYITEDDLRFTGDEIYDFLNNQGIAFSRKHIDRVSDATKGWAFAISLFSLSLSRNPKNLDLAAESMKQNIFRLMETEAFNDFPEKTKKLLIKFSMISDLPLSILGDFSIEGDLLREAPQLASFVWYDSFTASQRVHPLYWEFLKSKQNLLTPEQKRDTFQKAAKWCVDNGFNHDAMYYFAQLNDYERMTELLFSHPFKLPHDACEYYLDIILNLAPPKDKDSNINYMILIDYFVPLLLMGMGQYQQAEERALGVVSKWKDIKTPQAIKLLSMTYSNLTYIDMHTCTATHRYNAPIYIEKAVEYFKLSSLPPSKTSGAFRTADTRSLACLVGEGAGEGDFEVFSNAARRTNSFIEKTYHNTYYGYEDLVACELAFFKNLPDEAGRAAHTAILKAREKNQYSIEAMASQYLLRLSVARGDYPQAKQVLKQMESRLENFDFWNRHLLFDLYTGFFYASINLPELVPSWLILNEAEATSGVRLPIWEMVVCAKSHMAAGKYAQALTVLAGSYPRVPVERYVFGEITFSLLAAAARLQTGDKDGAAQDFYKAYLLSYGGVFEMPFVELGKHMRYLAALTSGDENCPVPEQWLNAVVRKASIHAKKAAVLTKAVKSEKKIDDSIGLSEREKEVLGDVYHGLSREEIAVNRYLSVNTVKKILQSIYIKLDASNNVDAIRIALNNNLIE
ncbi:MAG: LuxR C-terminal-related transcriptional regulator [Oscillospiraceae bacterium]|nr:LuxR C-terminal-related transcriptional regulator [Oscillospiraceae bacterium]